MKALTWLLVLLLAAACAGADTGGTSPAATATASAFASVEHGRALFRNKGCVTCHANGRVEGKSAVLGPIGPNLTDYTNDPEFLQRWLANPSVVRPGTQMPNLGLSAAEIRDLIAFLNEPR